MSMPEGAQQTLMNLAKSLMERIPSVTPDPISEVAEDEDDIRSRLLVLTDQNEQLTVKVNQMLVSSFSKGNLCMLLFSFSRLSSNRVIESGESNFMYPC